MIVLSPREAEFIKLVLLFDNDKNRICDKLKISSGAYDTAYSRLRKKFNAQVLTEDVIHQIDFVIQDRRYAQYKA